MPSRGVLFAVAATAVRVGRKYSERQDVRGAFLFEPVEGTQLSADDGPVEFAAASLPLIAADESAARVESLRRAKEHWPSGGGWRQHRVFVTRICEISFESFKKAFG